MFAGSRAKLNIKDCFTLNGDWAENNAATLYAALAADQVSGDLDTTMRDVTGLTLTLTPGTYQLTGSCLVTPATSTSGVKIGVEWTGTGTMSGNNIAYQNTNVLTNGVSYFGNSSLGSVVKTVNAGINGQPMQVKIDKVIVVTATATVRFQFGKQSAVATNLTVESGSYLLAERIAP
jgi:hypothetical protein